MAYKIDKGVPMTGAQDTGPKRYKQKGTQTQNFPWAAMEVGDALCIGEYTKKGMSAILTVANHSYVALNEGYRFACRKVDGKIYIWRIE